MPYIGKQPANVPVTASDIPNDSITTAKIVDAAITIADIGPNAVGSSEMADDAVGLNELSATGTTNSSTFLRGDNAWAVPPNTVYTHPNHSGDVTSSADGATTIANDAVTAAKLANSINTDIATGVTGNTTANAALPKTGGAMTGAITTNSTFDGRDVAADGVTADAALARTGGTMTNNLTLADGVRLNVGTNADLKLYHDNSSGNTFIDESGSGRLFIRASRIDLTSLAGDESMASFVDDAGAELFHNNVLKLEVVSNGIRVTDRVTGTGDLILATTDSNEKIHMDSDGYIKLETNGSERMRINSSGNVGIATTDGARRLTLDSQTSTTSLGGTAEVLKIAGARTDENYCGIGFHYDNSAGQTHSPAFIGYKSKNMTGSSNGDIVIATRSATTDSAPIQRMTITAAGKVGIGTDSPAATVDIASGHYQITQASGNTAKFGIVSGSDIEISGTSNNDIYFKRANSEKLRITSSGIDVTGGASLAGTLALSTGNISHASHLTLDVVGNINLDSDNGFVVMQDNGTSIGSLSHGGSGLFEISVEANNADMVFKGQDGGSSITALSLDMSDAGVATFNAGAEFKGNVLFGTNSDPTLILRRTGNAAANGSIDFQGNDGVTDASITFAGSTAAALQFSTAHSNAMTIAASGNVGIGDSDPSAKLQINTNATTTNGLELVLNSLTTGKGLFINSNAANANVRQLLRVTNDHTVATATTNLYLDNDSTGLIADFHGSGGVMHNAMRTQVFSFDIALNVSANFDIAITNTTNYFEIKAIIGYYPGTSYTADLHGLYAFRSDSGIGVVQTHSDHSSSNSGSWSVSNPNNTTLRITKNAGSSSSNARGFIEVKYRNA